MMLMPDCVPDRRPRVDNTMVKALARAFRWKRMLESGEFTKIAELAARGGLAVSYLARILRLAQLAPVIVEAVFEGRQPAELGLAKLLVPFPALWGEKLGRFSWVA